jgi:hypothetical protein
MKKPEYNEGPQAGDNFRNLATAPSAASEPSLELKSWALVELFGHQRIVGFLSQQTFGTGVLFRVDVPDLLKEGKVVRVGFTRYFGLSAIYSITPVSEDVVRTLLPSIDGTPGEARVLSSRSYRQDDDEY